MENLIRCDETHLPALSGLYGRAFLNDPLYQYIFPEAAQKEALIAWELGQVAHYGLRFGEGYATSDLTGAAICLPPGETDFTEARMAEVGMLDSEAHIGAAAEQRMMTFVNESERYHREVAPDPHWYLVVLGVEPVHQGQGIGRALLQFVTHKADKDRAPLYLETAEAHNVRFYQRHGFTVRAEAALPNGGAYLPYMVREPKL